MKKFLCLIVMLCCLTMPMYVHADSADDIELNDIFYIQDNLGICYACLVRGHGLGMTRVDCKLIPPDQLYTNRGKVSWLGDRNVYRKGKK